MELTEHERDGPTRGLLQQIGRFIAGIKESYGYRVAMTGETLPLENTCGQRASFQSGGSGTAAQWAQSTWQAEPK